MIKLLTAFSVIGVVFSVVIDIFLNISSSTNVDISTEVVSAVDTTTSIIIKTIDQDYINQFAYNYDYLVDSCYLNQKIYNYLLLNLNNNYYLEDAFKEENSNSDIVVDIITNSSIINKSTESLSESLSKDIDSDLLKIEMDEVKNNTQFVDKLDNIEENINDSIDVEIVQIIDSNLEYQKELQKFNIDDKVFEDMIAQQLNVNTNVSVIKDSLFSSETIENVKIVPIIDFNLEYQKELQGLDINDTLEN
jgi:hypothetical protein